MRTTLLEAGLLTDQSNGLQQVRVLLAPGNQYCQEKKKM